MKKNRLLKILLVAPLFVFPISLASCGVSTSQDANSPFVDTVFETYTCRFFDADGKEIYKVDVKEHENVTFEGENPIKSPSTYEEYKFIGWDESLDDITEDKDFHPLYESSDRYYTVTFVDENGEILYETEVKAGEEAVYKGATPTKPSDDDYDYTFSGWQSDVSEVTGDLTVLPSFDKTIRKYQVSFKVDGKTIHTQMVEKGKTIDEYTGPTPTKSSEEIGNGMYQIRYTFERWNVNLSTTVITGPLDVAAIFKEEQTLSDKFEFGDIIGGGGGSGNVTGETGDVDADKPGEEGSGEEDKIKYEMVFIGKDSSFAGYYLGVDESRYYYLLQYKNTVPISNNDGSVEKNVTVEYLVPFEYQKINNARGTCRFTFPNGEGEILFTFNMLASELNVVQATNISRSVSGDVQNYLTNCQAKLTEDIITEHNVQLRGYLSRLGDLIPPGFNLYL